MRTQSKTGRKSVQRAGEEVFVSVVIATRNRPLMLKRCLDQLFSQHYMLFETIVVDASSDEKTKEVIEQSRTLKYIRLPDGQNKMTQSRNLGVAAAKGEIIAFLDDDSLARPHWLSSLVSSYGGEDVGGVGGRVLGEAGNRLSGQVVGKVYRDGRHLDNFSLDLDNIIEVDRFMGCNMSFKAELFRTVGLFDITYDEVPHSPFEEVDFCTRARRRGYRLLFNSKAIVEHLNAPRDDGLPRSLTDPQVVFSYYRNRTYFSLVNFGWLGWHTVSLLFLNTALHLCYSFKNLSMATLKCFQANIRGKLLGARAAWQRRHQRG